MSDQTPKTAESDISEEEAARHASKMAKKKAARDRMMKTKDGEKVYNVTDKTKFSTTDFKGENAKESDLKALEKAASRKGKDGKVAGAKVEFEADGEALTEVKWKAGGKKKKE